MTDNKIIPDFWPQTFFSPKIQGSVNSFNIMNSISSESSTMDPLHDAIGNAKSSGVDSPCTNPELDVDSPDTEVALYKSPRRTQVVKLN